jgi:thioredoxin 1
VELLHFTASWCNPCKKMEPIISEFILENPSINYIKIDVDENSNLVKEYQIQSVPTFISKLNLETYKRQTGVMSKTAIQDMFN